MIHFHHQITFPNLTFFSDFGMFLKAILHVRLVHGGAVLASCSISTNSTVLQFAFFTFFQLISSCTHCLIDKFITKIFQPDGHVHYAFSMFSTSKMFPMHEA